MKTLKNDTRYIIKRVLIGVLIAIILFNARKCGVYAYTNEINVNGSTNSLVTNTSNLKYLSSYEDDDIKINYYLNNNVNFSDALIYTFDYSSEPDKIYFYFTQFRNVDLSLLFQISLGIERNIDPYSNNVVQFPPNIFLYNTNNDVCNTATNCYNNNYFGTGSAFTNNGTNRNNNLYYYDTVNHTLGTGFDSTSFSNYYKNGTISIRGINKDIPLSVGSENYVPDNFPPSGYSELDLTGYQGVIFVPKNYSTMNYNQLYNLDFNYYYKGRVRDGYFLLNNSNQHYYDTDILISDDDYTERNGFYTLAKVQTTEGITTTTTIEYSAFVVYNSSPTGDWQGDILPPYGESYVVYDSTLYDYYLVEDFSKFNQTICFYDFENNQICINVESLPTLNDILDDANSSTTNQDIPQQKINYILEFIKLPIRSLRRVAEGTCEAITLPIPIIGGTIQLNCLSSLFQNVLGSSFEFFRLIINGLLLYRITIHNIKVFKDVLDPSNTGIEVINL